MLNYLFDYYKKRNHISELSHWEYHLKLKLTEKSKVLHTKSKNIKRRYKLRNMRIKKLNEEYNLVVGFDDSLKVENHIPSHVSNVNRIINEVVRNFILNDANEAFLYIYIYIYICMCVYVYV